MSTSGCIALASLPRDPLTNSHVVPGSPSPPPQVADPDEEDDWKQWPIEEVRKHNTRHDAWMVLRGKVYNITRYLAFHPGSVEELMRAAGDDGTLAFDEVHPWVNADAMLEPCCIGWLAPVASDAPASDAPASDAPAAALSPDEWRSFEVLSREPASADSTLFRLRLGDGQQLGLQVGQHLQVRLRTSDRKELVRAYTPVSAVGTEGFVELLVRRCEPGALSKPLCDGLKAGSLVEMRGPRGYPLYTDGNGVGSKLSLPTEGGGSSSVDTTTIVSLSAGSGVAPTLFLLRSLLATSAAASPGLAPMPAISVVHSSRTAALVPALDELCRLVEQLDGARSGAGKLTLALAEPPKEGDGHTAAAANGRAAVVGRLDASLLAQLVPPPAAGVVLLVCGPPGFNNEVTAWAAAAGHANVHVF